MIEKKKKVIRTKKRGKNERTNDRKKIKMLHTTNFKNEIFQIRIFWRSSFFLKVRIHTPYNKINERIVWIDFSSIGNEGKKTKRRMSTIIHLYIDIGNDDDDGWCWYRWWLVMLAMVVVVVLLLLMLLKIIYVTAWLSFSH